MNEKTTVWVVEESKKRANDLMKFYSHSFSSLVKMLIDREWEKIFYEGSGRGKK